MQRLALLLRRGVFPDCRHIRTSISHTEKSYVSPRESGTASVHQVLGCGEGALGLSWTRCGKACMVQPNWRPHGHWKQSFSTVSPAQVPCWNCGNLARKPAGFFCQSCDLIQPTHPAVDFFAIMGLPKPSFAVDIKALDAKYKDLQRHLHPDKFSTASVEERRHAEAQSALVNEAYSVLKSPLKRAKYLLELEGRGEEAAGEGTIADPELLMEVMELRQDVQDTCEPAALQRLAAANREKEARCIQDLDGAFSRGDLAAAQQAVTYLRYITRIGEAIREKL